MHIEYLFFTIYVAVCFWVFPKISFIRHAGLTVTETRLLLAFKIAAGLAGAFYFAEIAVNTDAIGFNEEGKIQYELLCSRPRLFFTDFTNDIHTYGLGGLFESKYSFWAYLRFNVIYKFIGLLDIVSRGNFYFNTVIFCTLVFFGHIAFYRIYTGIYKAHRLKILVACFCLPSLLLYISCVQKDGIIFLSLGLVSYVFYKVLSTAAFPDLKYVFLFSLSALTIFALRNYIIIALAPAILTALLCKYVPYKKRVMILITYCIFFILFFLSGFSNSSLNIPAAVIQRKADFAALGPANTNIPMNALYPTVYSFMRNLPQAANHYFFRPYLWEFSQLSVFLTALELFFYQAIILVYIFNRKETAASIHPFNIFGFAFVFNMMLIIGYTIPNIGAIVRYRGIFWIFLVCPLLCNIDWKRMRFFRIRYPTFKRLDTLS